jgi:hypothetical protein
MDVETNIQWTKERNGLLNKEELTIRITSCVKSVTCLIFFLVTFNRPCPIYKVEESFLK